MLFPPILVLLMCTVLSSRASEYMNNTGAHKQSNVKTATPTTYHASVVSLNNPVSTNTGYFTPCGPRQDGTYNFDILECTKGVVLREPFIPGCVCLQGMWIIHEEVCGGDAVILIGRLATKSCYQIDYNVRSILFLGDPKDVRRRTAWVAPASLTVFEEIPEDGSWTPYLAFENPLIVAIEPGKDEFEAEEGTVCFRVRATLTEFIPDNLYGEFRAHVWMTALPTTRYRRVKKCQYPLRGPYDTEITPKNLYYHSINIKNLPNEGCRGYACEILPNGTEKVIIAKNSTKMTYIQWEKLYNESVKNNISLFPHEANKKIDFASYKVNFDSKMKYLPTVEEARAKVKLRNEGRLPSDPQNQGGVGSSSVGERVRLPPGRNKEWVAGSSVKIPRVSPDGDTSGSHSKVTSEPWKAVPAIGNLEVPSYSKNQLLSQMSLLTEPPQSPLTRDKVGPKYSMAPIPSATTMKNIPNYETNQRPALSDLIGEPIRTAETLSTSTGLLSSGHKEDSMTSGTMVVPSSTIKNFETEANGDPAPSIKDTGDVGSPVSDLPPPSTQATKTTGHTEASTTSSGPVMSKIQPTFSIPEGPSGDSTSEPYTSGTTTPSPPVTLELNTRSVLVEGEDLFRKITAPTKDLPEDVSDTVGNVPKYNTGDAPGTRRPKANLFVKNSYSIASNRTRRSPNNPVLTFNSNKNNYIQLPDSNSELPKSRTRRVVNCETVWEGKAFCIKSYWEVPEKIPMSEEDAKNCYPPNISPAPTPYPRYG